MKASVRIAIVCVGLLVLHLAGAPTQAQPNGTVMIDGVLTCGGQPVTIVGTNGPDVIIGTDGPDVIAGLGGDDEIYGGNFDDILCGGPGDDYIEGQRGEDRIFGEEGNDVLDGGVAGCCDDPTIDSNDDVITGGPGDDVLYCADFAQAGCTLYGDQGDDLIIILSAPQAIGGQNHAFGGNGNDIIVQVAGDAVLDGGNGDDILLDLDDDGSLETVTMIGGKGNDLLVSDDGSSTADMDGGKGADECVGGTTTTNCEG